MIEGIYFSEYLLNWNRYQVWEEHFRYNHFKLMDLRPSSPSIAHPVCLTQYNCCQSTSLTPTNQQCGSKRQERNTYTEEAVSLLSEQIQRRVSWDHQRWLFYTQNEEQQFCYLTIHSKSEEVQKIKQFAAQNIQEKQQSIERMRTPDALPGLQFLHCQALVLDAKQEQSEKQGKKGGCSCQKSKCLKMYCECFRNGEVCHNCGCNDCQNKEGDEKERLNAIGIIKQKQPMAFNNDWQYKGCRCSKSNCQKGYCDCFANGLICGKYCKCIQCFNGTNSKMGLKKKKGRSRHQ